MTERKIIVVLAAAAMLTPMLFFALCVTINLSRHCVLVITQQNSKNSLLRYFFSSQGFHLMVQKYSMQTKDLPRFSSKIVGEFSRFLLSSYVMGIKIIVDSSLSDFLPINVHHMHSKNYFKDFFYINIKVISTLLQFALILGLIHNDALRVRSSNVFNMTLSASHLMSSFLRMIFNEADFFSSPKRAHQLCIKQPHSHFCFHKYLYFFLLLSLTHSFSLQNLQMETQKRVLKKSIFITHRRWCVIKF